MVANGPWRARAFRLAQAGVLLALIISVVGALIRRGGDQIPLLDLWVFNAVYVCGALACLLRRSRGGARLWAWRSLAGAMLVTVVANAYFSLVLARLDSPPYPSPADVFYLGWYPLSYAAVLLLLRAKVRRFWPSMWLDGGVTALGAAAVLGYLVQPVLAVTGASVPETVVNLAYPLADVMLLVILIGGAAALGTGVDRALVTVTAGLALTGAADVGFLLQDASSTYHEGGIIDVTYLIGIAVLTLGAGLPDPDGAQRVPGSSAAVRVGWRVLALPTAAILASLAMLGLDTSGLLPEWARVSAAACVLAGLARVAMTFAEVRNLGDVHRQARTDELTGLPNRRALYEQSDQLLAAAGPEAPVAMLLLDLDRFKEINDSLGHAAGDELLILVARRARSAVRGRGLIARLGGDEFAIMLPDTAEAEAWEIAEQVRGALAGGFQVDTVTLHVDVSIGIGSAESPAVTRTELLRCADIAMYEAKATRTGVMAYSGVDTDHSVDRLRSMQDLRLALRGNPEGGRLLVHLQPQTRLETGALIGVEALVRWQHPDRGLLYPNAFLPAAETAALMGSLAETVLDLSLSACRGWWDAGRHVPVSVNMCAANVHDLTLPAKIGRALARHALPPRALVVELTEDSLMSDPSRARSVLDRIRRLGAGVSIDDYGTGYSSLAYLRDLAVDELKIDRAFTADLAGSTSAAAIVRHTVELGHALGLRLVAEGIEDQDALEILAELGCDVAQGYHIARPMPQQELLAWMQRHDETALSLAGDSA